MRHTALYTILLMLLLAFASCNNKHAQSVIEKAESMLITAPDSAFILLDSLKSENPSLSRGQQMLLELVSADAQNKAYIDFTTDSVMLEVVDYFDKHGTPNQQLRAHYLLGCTYRDLGDVPMELQCFQEATEKADTTKTDCDFRTLCSVYGQMARLYHDQFLTDEELKSLDICERINWSCKDTLRAIKAKELRFRAFHITSEADSVIKILEEARENYKYYGDTAYAAIIAIPIIDAYIQKGEYNKAKDYIDIFEKESGVFNDGAIIDKQYTIYYSCKGDYLLYKGLVDDAKKCYYKLLTGDYDEAAYKGLLAIYKVEHNADSIEKYAVLFANANDSSYLGIQHERIAQMTAMYDYGVQKKKAEKANKLAVKSSRTIFVMSIAVIVLVFIIIVLYFVNYFKKKATSIKINSLNADIEHYSLVIADLQNKNEEVDSLKSLLEDSKKELAKYKKTQTLSAFFDSELFNTFRKASRNGAYKITTKEWESLEILFSNTFSSYLDFIRSGHSMSLDQQHICMLIRMGFGETEMANVMDVDLKRISRIKTQVNQKLFNTQSAKTLSANLCEHF